MARVVGWGVTMSLDGFMAGPGQGLETPLGVGGERLHGWAFATRSMRELHGMEGGEVGVDDDWARRAVADVGATIMGRNMFGPVRGPWPDDSWRGWWGEDPPFHHPVFVLTHHPRAPLEMQGGTTFHFVTGGIDEALERTRDAASGGDVRVGGGASTLRQYLARGLLDALHVVVVPELLGGGERLLGGGLPGLPERYRCTRFEASPRAWHALLERREGDGEAGDAHGGAP